MVLVVVGHLIRNAGFTGIFQYIYSFHVPMFFLLSGMVAYYKKTVKESLVKTLKGNLIPYFVVSVLSVFIHAISQGGLTAEKLMIYVKTMAWGTYFPADLGKTAGVFECNQPLWFLPACATTAIFAILYHVAVKKIFKKDDTSFRSVLLLVAVSFGLSSLKGSSLFNMIEGLPFEMGVSLLHGMWLRELGYQIKEHKDSIKSVINVKKNGIKIFVPSFVLAGAGAIVQSMNGKISLVNMTTNRYPLFLVSFLLTAAGLYLFAEGIVYLTQKYKVLESVTNHMCQIGKNTIGVLLLHKIFILMANPANIDSIARSISYNHVAIKFTLYVVTALVLMEMCIVLYDLATSILRGEVVFWREPTALQP